ncbi:hypothetical protein FOL47_002612 [Perkinsus chesapeaki]|uniref:Uncharacterized protein n=1 Tax=Perkinsus chesapeaki TaxID=330153 RepID=A0A7J6MCJ2_PERCH|nr:hypothetical protein FOL47_002612 [Perkinsus chesapeaki]
MKTLTPFLVIFARAFGSSVDEEVNMRPKRGRGGGSKVASDIFAAPYEPVGGVIPDLYCSFNDQDEALCATKERFGDVESLTAFNISEGAAQSQVIGVTTYPPIGGVEKKKTLGRRAFGKIKSMVVKSAVPKTGKEPPLKKHDVKPEKRIAVSGLTEIDISKAATFTSTNPSHHLDFTFVDKSNDHKTYVLDRVEEVGFIDVFEAYNKRSQFKFGSAQPNVILEYDGRLSMRRDGNLIEIMEDRVIANRYFWTLPSNKDSTWQDFAKFYYGFFFKLPSGRYAFYAEDCILRGPPLVTEVFQGDKVILKRLGKVEGPELYPYFDVGFDLKVNAASEVHMKQPKRDAQSGMSCAFARKRVCLRGMYSATNRPDGRGMYLSLYPTSKRSMVVAFNSNHQTFTLAYNDLTLSPRREQEGEVIVLTSPYKKYCDNYFNITAKYVYDKWNDVVYFIPRDESSPKLKLNHRRP